MQKINPKKITKDKLIAMLEDAERKLEEAATDYDNLKSACQKHIDERNDELAESVKAKSSLNDEVIRLNVEMQSLRNDVQIANDELTRMGIENLQLEKIIAEQNTHPFRHLWKRLRKRFK